MERQRIGFIGLGNIGKPIAGRLAGAGYEMIVFDIADMSDRAPRGAARARSAADVAAHSHVVFLSLPTVRASESVVSEIAEAVARPRLVIETSTIGPTAARMAEARLASVGVEYVDAPVSGGVTRAYEGTLTTMYSGATTTLEYVRAALATYCSKIFHVGTEASQGQAMKLLNNYASIACMISTSEAIAYGIGQGLEMQTILDVINASSGQSFISQTLFPNHILPATFDSAATAAIVGKDLSLFLEEARSAGSACELGQEALSIFHRFAVGHADQDWLRIYEFIRDYGAQ